MSRDLPSVVAYSKMVHDPQIGRMVPYRRHHSSLASAQIAGDSIWPVSDRDEEYFDDLPPTRHAHSRSKAAGRLEVRAAVQRLAWSRHPLIYWTGKTSAAPAGSPAQVLQRRLESSPKGAYSVRLAHSSGQARVGTLNQMCQSQAPTIEEIIPINASLIARSLRRLLDLRRFPKLLPQLVGDVTQWRMKCEAAIAHAREILDTLTSEPGRIGETCLILGELTGDGQDKTKPLQRSRRAAQCSEPKPPAGQGSIVDLCQAAGLARAYSCWPRDVLFETVRQVGTAPLLRLARSSDSINEPDIAAAVRDRLLINAESLDEFLQGLPDWLSLCDRLSSEPDHRLHAVMAIQRRSIEAALTESGATGNPATFIRQMDSRRGSVFHHFLHSYEAHLNTAVVEHCAPMSPKHQKLSSLGVRGSAFNVVGAIRDLLAAQRLCGELLNDPERLTHAGLTVRCVKRGDQQQLLVQGVSQPLRFEDLPDLATHLLRQATDTRESLPRTLILMLAAVGALPNPAAAAGWVEACCRHWPLGQSGQEHAVAVLTGLQIAWTGSKPEHRNSATTMLDALAEPILLHALTELPNWQSPRASRASEILAQDVQLACQAVAAGLTSDELLAVYPEDRTAALEAILDHAPAQAKRFLEFLDAWIARLTTGLSKASRLTILKGWDLVKNDSRKWATAYVALGEDLLKRILELLLILEVLRSESIAFVDDMTDFLLGKGFAFRDKLPEQSGLTLRRQFLSSALPTLRAALRRHGKADAARQSAILTLFGSCLEVAHAATESHWPAHSPSSQDVLKACLTALIRHLDHPKQSGPPEFFWRYSHPQMPALVSLSRGRIERLITLGLTVTDLDYQQGLQIPPAWEYLRQDEAVAEVVSSAVAHDGLTARGLRMLARLGLCLQLRRHEQFRRELNAILAGDSGQDGLEHLNHVTMPKAADAASLGELVRWRADHALPERIAEILARPEMLRAELNALESRPALSPAAQKRLQHLRRILGDPSELEQWTARDLQKHLPAALDEARLARLEQIVDSAILSHFSSVLSILPPSSLGPRAQRNWDNALRLYCSVEFNRSLLRKLLEHEARGNRTWIGQQPENVEFLRTVRARGIDTDAWLAPRVSTVKSPAGQCRIEIETDPLHVLQMGNYFSTCLSEGGCNAFSTIANAVELNKRVLYVYDSRDTVIARKLIVMTREGQILGFRTYGRLPGRDDRSESDGWRPLKAALDNFCLELARRCGATLHPFPKESDFSKVCNAKPLALFAQWYNDGPEAFELDSSDRV